MDKSSVQKKKKEKFTDQEMIQLSSEDDSDTVVLRPPNTFPQRGGRMALRARGRGRVPSERKTTPIYIDLESDSDVDSKDQGVAFSLNYKNWQYKITWT